MAGVKTAAGKSTHSSFHAKLLISKQAAQNEPRSAVTHWGKKTQGCSRPRLKPGLRPTPCCPLAPRARRSPALPRSPQRPCPAPGLGLPSPKLRAPAGGGGSPAAAPEPLRGGEEPPAGQPPAAAGRRRSPPRRPLAPRPLIPVPRPAALRPPSAPLRLPRSRRAA